MGDGAIVFPFEKLESWQCAMDLSVEIYDVTRAFPKEELFGMTSQLRRAVISISSNLAEGCARFSPADKARFTEIATGSLYEVVSLLEAASRFGYIDANVMESLKSSARTLGRMLSGLHRAQSPHHP